MKKRVLVTGAGGFIGSHLVEALASRGYTVRAMVHYRGSGSWGWLENLDPGLKKNVEVLPGDVRDFHHTRDMMKGCQIVYHLAALIAIPWSYHAPGAYVATNIQGTLNVLQAAKELGTDKIVHTSTSEVYGTARKVPIDEEHPLQGQSPYSASKIGADQLAFSFFSSFNLPVAIIRPFNTYGPRQSARAFIPTVITQALKGDPEIRIGSLSPTRDMNYVSDTVAGFIAVGENKRCIGEVINIGSGREISMGDLCQLILRETKSSAKVICDSMRVRPKKSEVERLLAGCGKAKRLLKYKPQYSGPNGLRQGIRETIAWFSKSENLKSYKSGQYNL